MDNKMLHYSRTSNDVSRAVGELFNKYASQIKIMLYTTSEPSAPQWTKATKLEITCFIFMVLLKYISHFK